MNIRDLVFWTIIGSMITRIMQQPTRQQVISEPHTDTKNPPKTNCNQPKPHDDEQVLLEGLSSSASCSEDELSDLDPDILHVDRDTRTHIAVVAVTIMLFLLTHSPASLEVPLEGVLAQGSQMAEACFVQRSYPITTICDILGFASVTRLLDGCEGFLREMTLTWSRVIWGMCDLSRDAYGPSREASENFRQTSGIGYDYAFDKTLSTYHWHILREMCYYSRVLEYQDSCCKRKEHLTPRDDGLLMWFEDEADREMGNRSFVLWYQISIQEKISRLHRMRELVTHRLPLERLAENRPFDGTSNLTRYAAEAGKETLADFVEMRGIQEWIDRQLSFWEGVDRFRQDQGLELYSSIYSGFPLPRLYRSGIEAPHPGRQERKEGIYPQDLLMVELKKRRGDVV